VREQWGPLITEYLDVRGPLCLVVALLDVRRTPAEDDLSLLEMLREMERPVVTVATKVDKLSKSKVKREDPVPETTVSPEAIDRACARITSCEPAGSDSPSDCATEALTRPASGRRLTLEWVDCLDGAGSDCAAVRACSPGVSGDPCSGVDEGTQCDGDLLVSCWSGGIEFVSDCAAWGLACGIVEERATCRGDGPSCLEGSDRCEDRWAFMCIGFREVRYACDELVDGRVCSMSGGRGTCAPAAAECDAATTPGSCTGTSLTFCSATGGLVTVSCVELGFAGCVEEADRAVCGDPGE